MRLATLGTGRRGMEAALRCSAALHSSAQATIGLLHTGTRAPRPSQVHIYCPNATNTSDCPQSGTAKTLENPRSLFHFIRASRLPHRLAADPDDHVSGGRVP